MTQTNQPTTWQPDTIAFLLYFRDKYVTDDGFQLPYNFIADLLGREMGFYTTKNSCISAYRRFSKKSALYPETLIADYLAGMDVFYRRTMHVSELSDEDMKAILNSRVPKEFDYLNEEVDK